MKGWLAAGALVVVAAGVGSPGSPESPPVSAVDTAVGLDVDGLPPRIEYPGDLGYSCDGTGRAFGVEPDEPRAWEAAERGCLRGHIAVRDAPWPDGIHPVRLP